MDYPATVRATSEVSVLVVFSALIVGSDFALAPFVNVKLLDSIVFLVAFVYGFRMGAGVAIISETVWSVVSPWGAAGVMTPFLVGGELIFAVAGWWASRAWGMKSKFGVREAVFIGALMLLCASLWDLETNTATALVAYWPGLTLGELLATEVAGIPFALIHEYADFILGSLFVPAALASISRLGLGRGAVGV